MLLTLINKTNQTISIDSLEMKVAPYATKIKSIPDEDVTKQVNSELTSLQKKNYIQFSTGEDPQIDDAFEVIRGPLMDGVLRSDLIDAPDVTGGGTIANVGFQIKDLLFKEKASQYLVEFAVFDDAHLSIPSVTAILKNAIKGTIIAGENGAALKVLTDSNGEFECELESGTDQTNYLACSSTFGGPALVSTDIDSVTFSA